MQVTSEVAAHLADAGVEVRPYEQVLDDVREIAETGSRIWMDSAQVKLLIWTH